MTGLLFSLLFVLPFPCLKWLLTVLGPPNTVHGPELYSFHPRPWKRHMGYSSGPYNCFLPRLSLTVSLGDSQTHVFEQQFYFAEVLYAAILITTKTSILFFYLRIFPGIILRRITWLLIVLSLLIATTFVCVNAFQCTPIDHYWRQWDGAPGKCFSPSGPAWSVASAGIIIDFAMLSLPLHQIRHLNLHWRKKVSVGLMFGVGFL